MSNPYSASIIEDETFEGLSITSFDAKYYNCTFINCQLQFCFDEFQNCRFVNCNNVKCLEAVLTYDCEWIDCDPEHWQYGQQCVHTVNNKTKWMERTMSREEVLSL